MTYRDRILSCPRCGLELRRQHRRDAWRCVKCRGVLIKIAELIRQLHGVAPIVASSTVLMQERFPVTTAFPTRSNVNDDVDSCYPSTTRDIEMWWDGVTSSLYTEVSYASGPCYCGDAVRSYVRRVTRLPITG